MVPGDVFPCLMTKFSDFFAIRLTNIYNTIIQTKIWPTRWKKDFVTIIPKKHHPEGLGDLRNISCTLLASKIFESYVLDWLKGEVQLRSNQYGGVRGVSMDHLLVEMWQEILTNLEDNHAGTLVTVVVFLKILCYAIPMGGCEGIRRSSGFSLGFHRMHAVRKMGV